MSEQDIESRIIEAKREMFKAREKKTQPLTDKKIVAVDNALMISTMLKAYGVMNEVGHLEAAKEAMDYLLKNHFGGEGYVKTSFDDKKGAPAQLDDFAATINALIDLYEAEFNIDMLEIARELTSEMISIFWDKKECVFKFCRQETDVLTNYVPFFDEGKPSAQALALEAVNRMGYLTNSKELKQIADSLIDAIKPTAFKLPQAMLYTINALYSKRCHPIELAFSGNLESDKGIELFNAVKYSFIPSATILYLDDSITDTIKENYPVLKNSPEIPKTNEAAVHFIQDAVCSEGIADAETVEYILCPYAKLEEPEA